MGSPPAKRSFQLAVPPERRAGRARAWLADQGYDAVP